jgi:AraC-like DNA-binding protein
MESIPGKGSGILESFVQYLTFSEEDENLGMVCTDAGYTEIPPGSPYPPNKKAHSYPFCDVVAGRILSEFQIVYISKGQGIFVVEGTTHKVIPGSILFILPGIKHHYKPDAATGWDEYWVGFKGDFFSRLLEKKLISSEHIFLEIGIHSNIISIFHQIFNEILTQQSLYQVKACSGILTLIAEILTYKRRIEQPNHYQKIVEKAKYFISSNLYKKGINISDISEQIGISASRLNEIFRIHTSMTPYQYYIHLKLNEAKILLEDKNLSIKEIAIDLGFEDQGHFSRLFKNKTGFAPSDWKTLYAAKIR